MRLRVPVFPVPRVYYFLTQSLSYLYCTLCCCCCATDSLWITPPTASFEKKNKEIFINTLLGLLNYFTNCSDLLLEIFIRDHRPRDFVVGINNCSVVS